jgi:hypothetical protein
MNLRVIKYYTKSDIQLALRCEEVAKHLIHLVYLCIDIKVHVITLIQFPHEEKDFYEKSRIIKNI